MRRICFVSITAYGYFADDIDTAGGGAQRQLYLLSKELSGEFDIHFIVGDFGQNRVTNFDSVTLTRAYEPTQKSTVKQKFIHLGKLFRAMKSVNADVYVSYGGPQNAAVVFLLSRLLRRRWVYHIASDADIENPRKYVSPPFLQLYTTALKRADAIVAQTEHQQSIANNEGIGCPQIVPNGYPDIGHPKSSRDRSYVLWVGRLEKTIKRPHLFVELARRLPKADFLLVGPAETGGRYQKQIGTDIQELDNIKYIGPVNPNIIHEYYQDAICLVNTSTVEGFPNTFLEAWRAGTPVVGLDVNPNRFLDINTPWDQFAEGDISKLVEIVNQINNNQSIVPQIGEICYEQFSEKYSIVQVANRYADVLSEV